MRAISIRKITILLVALLSVAFVGNALADYPHFDEDAVIFYDLEEDITISDGAEVTILSDLDLTVEGIINIETGGRLIIEEGVKLTFKRFENDPSGILVVLNEEAGTAAGLIVQGTKFNKVTLTSEMNGNDVVANSFFGIILNEPGLHPGRDENGNGIDLDQPFADLEYCIIIGADNSELANTNNDPGGIICRNSKLLMYGCEIKQCIGNGIVMWDTQWNPGQHNVTTFEDGRFNGSEWYDDDNERWDNGDHRSDDGIRGVEKSKIHDNTLNGIYVKEAWSMESVRNRNHKLGLTGEKLLRQCEIYNNGNHGVYIYRHFSEWDRIEGWLWNQDAWDHKPFEIANCFIHDNEWNGIRGLTDNEDQDYNGVEDGNFAIWNNIIFNNGQAFESGSTNNDAAGVYLTVEADREHYAPSMRFMHNTVWENNGYGMILNLLRSPNVTQPTDLFRAGNSADPDVFYSNLIGQNGSNCIYITGTFYLEQADNPVHIQHNAFRDDTTWDYVVDDGEDWDITMSNNVLHHQVQSTIHLKGEGNFTTAGDFRAGVPDTDAIPYSPMTNQAVPDIVLTTAMKTISPDIASRNDGHFRTMVWEFIGELGEVGDDIEDRVAVGHLEWVEGTYGDIGAFGGILSNRHWEFRLIHIRQIMILIT